MFGLRDDLDKSDSPAVLLSPSLTSPASPESPISLSAQADVEVSSPLRCSPERQPLGGERQSETVDDDEGYTPWWCSRLAFCALVLILTLILTSLLLYYGRAHLSASQMEDLAERMDEMEDANGTISAAHADTLMGHVIDVPRRCEDGFRFFRGRCRRMF